MNHTIEQLLGILLGISVGYLFGSISWSILITKILFKSDIRKIGSGNAGATNVLRKYGLKFGMLTFFLDALKPILVATILRIFQMFFFQNTEMVNVGIFAVVVGHAWPIYYKFKGGKGASCMWGAVIALNVYIGLIVWFVILFVLLLSKYMSISTILFGITCATLYSLVIFLPIDVLSVNWWFFDYSSRKVSVFILWAIVVLVIGLHHKNISRLMKGQENKTILYKKNRN